MEVAAEPGSVVSTGLVSTVVDGAEASVVVAAATGAASELEGVKSVCIVEIVLPLGSTLIC